MNNELVVKNIRDELKKYVVENEIKALIIGVSGGVDSALCCILAKPVCDELTISLIGRSLPLKGNEQDEIERAKKVGEAFCTDFKEVDLSPSYEVLKEFISENKGESESEKIRLGNIKARVRMIYLYDLARANNGLVLSTDNWTELCESYFTLHGDVGDLSMIQFLWKTEVYEIASYLQAAESDKDSGLTECIDAVPTDGLGITSSDFEQLGVETYAEVDKIIKTWLTEDEDSFIYDDCYTYLGREKDYRKFVEFRDSLIDHPVVQRHEKNAFKRNNPYMIMRESLVKKI